LLTQAHLVEDLVASEGEDQATTQKIKPEVKTQQHGSRSKEHYRARDEQHQPARTGGRRRGDW